MIEPVSLAILLLIGATSSGAMFALAILLRRSGNQSGPLAELRILAEQSLAGARAEAETTRVAIRATAADIAERLAAMRGAIDVATEQIRTILSREQGDLRLAFAQSQLKSAEQIAVGLREMREGNEAKLAEIQKTVNEQLHAAVEKQMSDSFARVIDQFAAVQKAMSDVQAVTAQIGDIKRLFTNVKTRGGWGETQVRAMLDDILPPGAYETNRKIRPDSDEAVEFAVIMPMRGEVRPLLPIDAKFPVEDYERLLAASEAGDVEAERLATRGLERRIRAEAAKIATKYIHPPLTVEFAILYLPTDSLYAEVARIPGLIDDIGRNHRVLLMGPSLLPALLRTVHLGFVTLALEQKADRIRDLLGATRTEMVNMDRVLDTLARQVGTFGNTIARARTRTKAVGRKLRGIEALETGRAEQLLDLQSELNDSSDSVDDSEVYP
jgi:DNA recombination protein RmuC